VEVTLATPLLLLLLLLVVQFGVWWHATHVAQAGADQALAAARAHDGTPGAGQGQAPTVLDQLAGDVLLHPRVDVNAVTVDGRPQVRVEVAGTAATVVPGFALPVRVVAQGPVERWTTPGGRS
jgi:Flp pilus assembly protein TadG